LEDEDTNGVSDGSGFPFGRWRDRFIDWFRDLGFLQKSAVEAKAEAARTE